MKAVHSIKSIPYALKDYQRTMLHQVVGVDQPPGATDFYRFCTESSPSSLNYPTMLLSVRTVHHHSEDLITGLFEDISDPVMDGI
jgi:hypothetical protein